MGSMEHHFSSSTMDPMGSWNSHSFRGLIHPQASLKAIKGKFSDDQRVDLDRIRCSPDDRLVQDESGKSFWHFNTHWCVHSEGKRVCNEDVRYRGARPRPRPPSWDVPWGILILWMVWKSCVGNSGRQLWSTVNTGIIRREAIWIYQLVQDFFHPP